MSNKNMYEVFDEFEMANTDQERMLVIQKNLSQTLVNTLKLTYHPAWQWLVTEMPQNYKVPDTKPGISVCQLGKCPKTTKSLTPNQEYLFVSWELS